MDALVCLVFASTVWSAWPEWPDLLRMSGSEEAAAHAAPVPLPLDLPATAAEALARGSADWGGRRVQGQTVALWPGDEERPRRVILRWIDGGAAAGGDTADHAGWSLGYTLVEGNEGEVNWQIATRHIPLDETEYEMYRLDLRHGGHRLGLRLGLRTDKRVYWWQFVRADFLQRGPVFDLIRAGGPIYNEESSLQGDLYLVLYASGVIEAYAHFASHMREDKGIDLHGVPVVGIDVPEAPDLDLALDGARSRFNLSGYGLDLDWTVHMADPGKQGSLRTEDGVVVLQPWLDQEIYGGLLVYDEGVPEHRIIRQGGTTAELAEKSRLGEADRYFTTTVGEKRIPKGMARSFRLILSMPGTAPEVARYAAPAWWHAVADALPTQGCLPARWWAVPRALDTAKAYTLESTQSGPFEYGRGAHDGDGSQGAAMLTLGYAGEALALCADALPACYWRADIPIDHTDFSISEIPYFSAQWVVQPYSRFMSAVHGYWETGDPYLLETAQLAGDAYYRFYATNRPHRFVGRDVLPVYGLLDLYRTTGERLYLRRVQRILADARGSYDQTEWYWPGHQSGVGPNGVGRRPNYIYTPALLARMHVGMVEAAGAQLRTDERHEAMAFARSMVDLVETKWNRVDDATWAEYAVALLYTVLPALARFFPEESARYDELLVRYNTEFAMPEAHSGDKAYTWISGAVRHDAWAVGATWEEGALRLQPRMTVLNDPRAPRTATVFTPKGPIELSWESGGMRVVSEGR